jgi:clan AA aspartic protease (TIGR02281 family)
MTENTNHEPGSELFDRIRQMVTDRGVDIRQQITGNALRLDFADGQRILINFDVNTRNVWLAASSGGIEFIHLNGTWRAHDRSELFARLGDIIEQTIASNPLNSRAPIVHSPQVPGQPEPVIYREAKESHGLRNALILLLAGSIGFWAAQRMNQPGQSAETPNAQSETLSVSQLDPNQQCEGGFPLNGSVTVFPESRMHSDDPNDPEITLKNDHTHPLLLILAAPNTVIPSMSVLVHARQNVTLRLPAGQYDMLFSVGNFWCNARRGFSDGHTLKFDKSLTVESDRPVQLAMQSSGAGMEDFQLFVRTATPEVEIPRPTFSGDGSMEVHRHPNGHFYLPGSIENVPVTFMVDTGASVTSISADIAKEAGIRNCKEVQFQTANGAATGCIALVSRMTLGNFELSNITVAVMPNMEVNLLGANVLRNFQVSQSGSDMLIGRR